MPHSLRQTLSRQDTFTVRNKMDKNEVISFFDIHSTTWDENMEKDDSKMNENTRRRKNIKRKKRT